MVFFCGCQPCAELARALGPDRLANADVYFRGSEGDAREFQKRHRLTRTVQADENGTIALRYGVQTCPSVVLPGRGVIGNGRVLKDTDLVQVAHALEEGS
ncbi:MAG: hypothetical protein KatS3mg015_0497 [Fimbriimonadales bacterium]|nr:MAG: hypothetical protein KatS3mg015_0497 [Fimbriimonadales bacterium]